MVIHIADLDPPKPGVVRTIFNICKAWQLTDEQARHLLGATDVGDLEDWRQGDLSATTGETAMRMGHMLGIYGLLVALTGSHDEGVRWIGSPNEGAFFSGAIPLEYLLGGGLDRLADTRFTLRDVRDGLIY